MKNLALKSAGAASLLTAAALVISGGKDNKPNGFERLDSMRVVERVHHITSAERTKPFFTAKDTQEILEYVQKMNEGLKGMSDEAMAIYAKNLHSLRLSKEEIKENWDILMQPVLMEEGEKQESLLVFLSGMNNHIRDTISSADFIHENWALLLDLPQDPSFSPEKASKHNETLLDYCLMQYRPTSGDPLLANHLGVLMKWHFDKVKTGQFSRRDPLGWWLQNGKDGFLSYNDIAPYIPLIDAELDNEWHDQHHSPVISLLQKNNIIISDSDIVTRWRLQQPGGLRQPAADEPLNFGRN